MCTNLLLKKKKNMDLFTHSNISVFKSLKIKMHNVIMTYENTFTYIIYNVNNTFRVVNLDFLVLVTVDIIL